MYQPGFTLASKFDGSYVGESFAVECTLSHAARALREGIRPLDNRRPAGGGHNFP